MSKLTLLKTSSTLAVVAHIALNSAALAELPKELIDYSTPLTKSVVQAKAHADELVGEVIKAAEVAYTLKSHQQTDIQKQFHAQESIYEAGRKDLAEQIMGSGLTLDNKSPTFAAEAFNILSSSKTFLGRLTDSTTQQDSYNLATKLVNMGAAIYSVDSENLKQRLEKSKKATEYSQVYQEIEIVRRNIQALQDFQLELLEDLKKDKKTPVDKIFQRHLDVLARMHSKLYKEIKSQDNTITSMDQIREIIGSVATSLQNELKTKYLKQNQLYRQEVQQMLSGNVNTAADIDEVVHVFTRNNGEFSGYVGYSSKENRLYVCFAGSKSQQDWLYNLTGWNGGVQSDSGLLQDLVFHSGFVKHFNEAATDFVESMTEFFTRKGSHFTQNGLEICGAGHSLGGALAEMFTAATNEMAKKQVPEINIKVSVVTAGAPNNIAKAARGSYDDKFNGAGNVIHFANKYDLVPRLAFWRDNNAVARVQNGMDSLFFNHHKMFVWLNTNPHSAEAYSQAAPVAIKQWQDYLAKAKISAEKLMTKQDGLQKAKALMDQEAAKIETYKVRLEEILAPKPVELTSSIYDVKAADLSFARLQAFDMADSTVEDVEENITYFEQEKKAAREKAKEISKKLEDLDKSSSSKNAKNRRQRVVSAERDNRIAERVNLNKQLEEQKTIMAEWDVKIQELQAKKAKLKGIRKILKEATNKKFTFNKSQGFFGWVLGH